MKNLKLRSDVWDKPATSEDVKDMKKELSKWGIAFIVWGIISIVILIIFGSKLETNLIALIADYIISGVVVGIGILINLIRKRVMYLLVGVTLIIFGVFRFFGSFLNFIGMSVGMLLFILGLNQIKKYKLYKTE